MWAMAHSGFGERLRVLLDERDMTQAELSRCLHLGKSTVSQYISGARTPDLSTARRIAEFLSVSLDYLLGRTEIRWPAVLKDPDIQTVVNRAGELTPVQRRKVLEYIDYLQYESRRRRGGEAAAEKTRPPGGSRKNN